MKKLTLNLDDLQVESFETIPENIQGQGTVFGYDSLDPTTPCFGCNTANPNVWTCPGSNCGGGGGGGGTEVYTVCFGPETCPANLTCDGAPPCD